MVFAGVGPQIVQRVPCATSFFCCPFSNLVPINSFLLLLVRHLLLEAMNSSESSGEAGGSVTVELFLDLCCPFSKRMLMTVAGQPPAAVSGGVAKAFEGKVPWPTTARFSLGCWKEPCKPHASFWDAT